MFVARLFIVGAVLLGASNVALAKKPKGDPEVLRQQAQQVCTNDAMTLCGDVITDEAATLACMAQKRAQLTPLCRKAFDALAKAK